MNLILDGFKHRKLYVIWEEFSITTLDKVYGDSETVRRERDRYCKGWTKGFENRDLWDDAFCCFNGERATGQIGINPGEEKCQWCWTGLEVFGAYTDLRAYITVQCIHIILTYIRHRTIRISTRKWQWCSPELLCTGENTTMTFYIKMMWKIHLPLILIVATIK